MAKKNKVLVHLDGARIFNAAVYLRCDVKELTGFCDSVMFCLSKGLCAPVGSILAGSKEFISKARKYRKMLGGGLRQAGVLAAACLVALNEMTGRLAEDHENIKILAEGLGNIKGISIEQETLQTNILMADVAGAGYTASELVNEMKDRGILTHAITDRVIRFVTHHDVNRDDVEYAIQIIKKTL
ncbi:MAG: beta-eliminating lyase-related protein, partial [Halanaerobiales bacterium]|nr:beta-eliminating lyase-related protein [Halanaerobiales bacterium]